MADFSGNFQPAPQSFRGTFDNDYPGNFFPGSGTRDDLAPVVSGWAPEANSTLDRADTVAVTVADTVGLSSVCLSARFDALGLEELVYDGAAFSAAYSGSAVVVTPTSLAFVLVRDAGWLDAMALRITAVDGAGNRTMTSASYEIRGALAVPPSGQVPAGFSRPTLQDLIDRSRADFKLLEGGEAPLFRATVEAVLARVMPGLAHGLHGHMQWVSDNVLPLPGAADTTIGKWARMLLKVPIRPATPATGTPSFVASAGTTLLAGTELRRGDGQAYTVTVDTSESGGTIQPPTQASVAGDAGNAPENTELRLLTPVAGVATTGDVLSPGLTGGSDVESIESIQQRVQARMRDPSKGGSEPDYVAWAQEAGADRAWAVGMELGPGLVTVRFLVSGDNPIPSAAQVTTVQAHIDTLRPATATIVVVAPIKIELNPAIQLNPDLPETRAAVVSALRDLLRLEAIPGQVIPRSHITEAISGAPGEYDHVLTSPAADVDPGPGGLVVLGTPTWS